jgi:hypothetical protein
VFNLDGRIRQEVIKTVPRLEPGWPVRGVNYLQRLPDGYYKIDLRGRQGDGNGGVTLEVNQPIYLRVLRGVAKVVPWEWYYKALTLPVIDSAAGQTRRLFFVDEAGRRVSRATMTSVVSR